MKTNKTFNTAFALGLIGAVSMQSSLASALTYQTATDVSFTINPSLTVSLSAADLTISNLAPGTSLDSNTITVSVSTNAAYGYVLNANVGQPTNYETRNLVLSNSDANFASVAYGSSLTSITTDNTWGFSYKTSESGASWSNYSGLPRYDDATNTTTLISTTETTGDESVDFKIAARAGTTQPGGEYKNVINFIAVANPEPELEPVACEANKICYNVNSLGPTEGTMGKQTKDDSNNNITGGSTVTLLASNFSRTGYGFAGWSDVHDYATNSSAHLYGPQETITTPSNMSSGLPLYAVWIKSEGSLQDTSKVASVCNRLITAPTDGTAGLGSVSALTDARDNQTYAIAKLADGNCWMIENLRLETAGTVGNNQTDPSVTNASLSQGYGTSATYGNFTGLATAESSNFTNTNPPVANSLYSTDGTTTNIIQGGDSSYYYARMPRYNNLNTVSRATNPTSNTFANNNTTGGMYSYGNYYTWAAAMASVKQYTGSTSTDDEGKTSETANTSLCPTGWRLPYGRSTGNGATSGGFYNLNYKINNDANVTDSTASLKIRSFPNNFLYSGLFTMSSADNRGSVGDYWSSTSDDSKGSISLGVRSTYVYPGIGYSRKINGYSIRCVAGS